MIYVRGDYTVHVPYGILQIGAILEKAGHEVKLFDSLFENFSLEIIKEFKPDIIGLSYITFNINKTKELIQLIKGFDSFLPIIAGGPHPTSMPEEALTELGIDIVVIGEAESILPKLVLELEKKNPNLRKLKGIVFKDKYGKIVFTQKLTKLQDMNLLPFPAYHLIDMDKYLIPPGYIRSVFLNRVITLYTSRSCPYTCSFCAVPNLFGKKVRYYSLDRLFDHLNLLVKKYRVDGIYFSDEVFTLNRERLVEICKQLKKLKLSWGAQTRVDLVDEDILKVMSDSGCKQLDFGIESGSDRILKVINKRITIGQIEKAFLLVKKTGIRRLATVMVGHPTETEDDLKLTYSLIKKIKPDYTLTQFFTPLPGTEAFNWAVKNKFIEKDYYKNLDYHFYTSDKSFVNLSNVSDKILSLYKRKLDNLTFARNYLSLITFPNMKFLLMVLWSNIVQPKKFCGALVKIAKTKNIDEFIVSILNNYQLLLVTKAHKLK